jgi:hypothetical protein
LKTAERGLTIPLTFGLPVPDPPKAKGLGSYPQPFVLSVVAIMLDDLVQLRHRTASRHPRLSQRLDHYLQRLENVGDHPVGVGIRHYLAYLGERGDELTTVVAQQRFLCRGAATAEQLHGHTNLSAGAPRAILEGQQRGNGHPTCRPGGAHHDSRKPLHCLHTSHTLHRRSRFPIGKYWTETVLCVGCFGHLARGMSEHPWSVSSRAGLSRSGK